MTHITITHLSAETCVTGSCRLVRFQPDKVSVRFNHLYAAEKFQDHQSLLHLTGRPSSSPDPACARATALSTT